jgi:hypothetical protein
VLECLEKRDGSRIGWGCILCKGPGTRTRGCRSRAKIHLVEDRTESKKQMCQPRQPRFLLHWARCGCEAFLCVKSDFVLALHLQLDTPNVRARRDRRGKHQTCGFGQSCPLFPFPAGLTESLDLSRTLASRGRRTFLFRSRPSLSHRMSSHSSIAAPLLGSEGGPAYVRFAGEARVPGGSLLR